MFNQRLLNDIEAVLGAKVKEELTKKKKVATGALLRSIKVEPVTNGGTTTFNIISDSYITNIDQGRRPGSFPPIEDLKDWASKKLNIQGDVKITSAAYAIGNKIRKFGVKATPILDEAFQQSLPAIDVLIDKYANEILSQYISI